VSLLPYFSVLNKGGSLSAMLESIPDTPAYLRSCDGQRQLYPSLFGNREGKWFWFSMRISSPLFSLSGELTVPRFTGVLRSQRGGEFIT
jgi:hypothetical protein